LGTDCGGGGEEEEGPQRPHGTGGEWPQPPHSVLHVLPPTSCIAGVDHGINSTADTPTLLPQACLAWHSTLSEWCRVHFGISFLLYGVRYPRCRNPAHRGGCTARQRGKSGAKKDLTGVPRRSRASSTCPALTWSVCGGGGWCERFARSAENDSNLCCKTLIVCVGSALACHSTTQHTRLLVIHSQTCWQMIECSERVVAEDVRGWGAQLHRCLSTRRSHTTMLDVLVATAVETRCVTTTCNGVMEVLGWMASVCWGPSTVFRK
jgi:hypothetical protein